MKERPILFSAPMVRALLACTKTQTRRVVKPQPPGDYDSLLVDAIYPVVIDRNGDDQPGAERYGVTTNNGEWCLPCPYGQPGDRLWVREAWGAHFIWDDVPPSEIPNDGKECLFYRADGFSTGRCSQTQRDKWRPSIHMPRWASRITLEIISVRVERLHDISEADAVAEGLAALTKDGRTIKYGIPDSDGLPGTDDSGWPWQNWHLNAVGAYRHLWESINGPGSWDANPWVWVVEFKRVIHA